MGEPQHDRGPLRQFSVTLTEHNRERRLTVLLRWRTFPCTAQHWDGMASATVEWPGGPIQSQAALREALSVLSVTDWQTGPVPRR